MTTVFNSLSSGGDRNYNSQWSPGKAVAGSPIVPVPSPEEGGDSGTTNTGESTLSQQLQSRMADRDLLAQLSQSTTETTEELLQDLIDRDMARVAANEAAKQGLDQ